MLEFDGKGNLSMGPNKWGMVGRQEWDPRYLDPSPPDHSSIYLSSPGSKLCASSHLTLSLFCLYLLPSLHSLSRAVWFGPISHYKCCQTCWVSPDCFYPFEIKFPLCITQRKLNGSHELWGCGGSRKKGEKGSHSPMLMLIYLRMHSIWKLFHLSLWNAWSINVQLVYFFGKKQICSDLFIVIYTHTRGDEIPCSHKAQQKSKCITAQRCKGYNAILFPCMKVEL